MGAAIITGVPALGYTQSVKPAFGSAADSNLKRFKNERDTDLEQRDKTRRTAHQTARFMRTSIHGLTVVRQCEVKGDVRLNNLDAPDSEIHLIEVRVAGSVHADGDDSRYRSDSDADSVEPHLRTHCSTLALRQCTVEGSVELTGLEVHIPEGTEAVDVCTLEISDSKVKQVVSLVDTRTARRSAAGDYSHCPTKWAADAC